MRLWRTRRSEVLIETAPPPPYSSQVDFVAHALNNPANGWYEPLYGRRSVGTVDRCLQLTAQQIAEMPLRYKHSESTQGFRPKWVTDPDPAWYPNGIYDAVFAAVWSIYSQGDAFLYVTSRYESGYPQTWTLLDAVTMKVTQDGGSRAYESNRVTLDPRDVLQVSRNPNGGLKGTSALEAYWSNVASAYAAESYAADVYYSSGVNRMALKFNGQRLSQEQAAAAAGRLGGGGLAADGRPGDPAAAGRPARGDLAVAKGHDAARVARVGRDADRGRLRRPGDAAEHCALRWACVPSSRSAVRALVALGADVAGEEHPGGTLALAAAWQLGRVRPLPCA